MDKEIKSIGYIGNATLLHQSVWVYMYLGMRVEGRYELVRSTENKLSVIKLYMPTIYMYTLYD